METELADANKGQSLLLLGVGNRLAGDDGVGPELIERLLARSKWTHQSQSQSLRQFCEHWHIESAAQLLVEMAEEWCSFRRVVIADASLTLAPGELWRLESIAAPIAVSTLAAFGRGEGNKRARLSLPLLGHQLQVETIWRLSKELYPERASYRLDLLHLAATDFALGAPLSPLSEQVIQELLDGRLSALLEPIGD